MKYVLGGGLAGLITSYYNPEYEVITPEISGFIESKIGRAFVVIHEDDRVASLFRELEVPSFVKEIQLGYYEPSFGLTHDPPDWFTRRYLHEKLPKRMQPPADAELGGSPGDEFRALFVDENLIDALAENVDVIEGKVTSIGPDTLHVGDPKHGKELEWESLVSTMPADVLKSVIEADVDWELDSHPMTYAEVESVPAELRTKPWDYLYRVDERPETPSYHRVIRHMISHRFFVEYRGTPEPDVSESIVNPRGVIAKEDIESPYPGLHFNGRFARWNPDLLTNDVARRAAEGFE